MLYKLVQRDRHVKSWELSSEESTRWMQSSITTVLKDIGKETEKNFFIFIAYIVGSVGRIVQQVQSGTVLLVFSSTIFKYEDIKFFCLFIYGLFGACTVSSLPLTGMLSLSSLLREQCSLLNPS